MRLPKLAFFAAAAVASVAAATPAMANEGRVEAHVAADWSYGDAKASIGLGAGYDFDLANTIFIGPEASVDKLLTAGTHSSVQGGLRAGVAVPALGKVFVAAGASTDAYKGGTTDMYFGAGLQHTIEPGTYAKIEFLHYTAAGAGTTPSRNAISFGIGAKFG